MKQISSDFLKQAINEAINEMFGEAAPVPLRGGNAGGPPTPLKAPTPLRGGNAGGPPMPLNKGVGAPTPLGGNGAALSPQNPPLLSTTGADDMSFKGEKTKNGFRPGVNDCKYGNFFETLDPNMQDETVLKIDFDYIHNLTAQRWVDILNKQFGNVLLAKKSEKPWLANKKMKTKEEVDENNNFKYFIRVCILPGKNDDFLNIADQIIDTLYQMPKVVNRMTKFTVSYDPGFETELIQRVKDIVRKTPTDKEIEEVNIRIADSWVDLLSQMNDIQVRQKLGNINGFIANAPATNSAANKNIPRGAVAGDNGFAAGHQLTAANAFQIYLQDPNATFVTQEFPWRRSGHEVIDPTKFILVTVPSKKKTTADDIDKGARGAGFAGGKDEFDTRNKRGELGGGNVFAVRMNAQKISKDNVFFYTIKMYDVANTRVMPGMTSKFLEGPGQDINLKDNLLGIPNAAARTAGYVPNTIATAAQAISSDGSSNPHIAIIRDALFDVAISYGADVPSKTNNPDEDIVNCAYAYAEKLLSKGFQGISVSDTQKAFCDGFTGALAICVGVKSDTARMHLEKAREANGKDSKLSHLIIQWGDELGELLNKVVRKTQELLAARKQVAAKKTAQPVAAPAAAQPAQNTQANVIEEGEGVDANSLGIHIMSAEEFANLLGVNPNENDLYEEENDFVSDETIKESFFSFLDRMEKLW